VAAANPRAKDAKFKTPPRWRRSQLAAACVFCRKGKRVDGTSASADATKKTRHSGRTGKAPASKGEHGCPKQSRTLESKPALSGKASALLAAPRGRDGLLDRTAGLLHNRHDRAGEFRRILRLDVFGDVAADIEVRLLDECAHARERIPARFRPAPKSIRCVYVLFVEKPLSSSRVSAVKGPHP